MQLRGGPVLGENGRAVGIHEPVELGPTADLAAYDVDMTVTRRPATAAELARLEPSPTARPVRPGHAMHLVPRQNPRSWRNYRSALGADAPAPSSIEEEPVTPVTTTPPAIPCGDCLHEPVCGLKALLPSAYADDDELAAGLLVRYTFTVECDHHLDDLAAVKAVTRIVERLDDPEPEPGRRPSGSINRARGELAAQRAAEVMAAIERHGGDRRAAAAELGMKPSGARDDRALRPGPRRGGGMKRAMRPFRVDDLPAICLDCGARVRWVAERFAWLHVERGADHAPRLTGLQTEHAS